MKPMVGRFVMDDEGVRVEVSTVTFAELMSRKLVEPLGERPIVWVLAGSMPIPVVVKAPKK